MTAEGRYQSRRPAHHGHEPDHPPMRRTRHFSILPLELLERVLEAAADVHTDVSCKTLARCALVCKSWLPIARRLLYQDIYVDKLDLVFVLYASISFQPDLGALIRVLDISEVFLNQRGLPLSRYLDVMPNIQELTVALHHIRDLHHHPRWHQIDLLRLFEGQNVIPLPESHMFPSNLMVLIFQNENSLLNSSRDWTQLDFPNLVMLVFNGCQVRPRNASKAAILPNAPKLQYLSIVKPNLRRLLGSEPQPNDILTILEVLKQIIQEPSNRLKYVELDMESDWPGDLFSASVLRGLGQLETLKYAGKIENNNAVLKDTLPPSLQEVHIGLFGTYETTQKLLASFTEATCLPKLYRCPSVILRHASDHEQHFLPLLKLARTTTYAIYRSGLLPGCEQRWDWTDYDSLQLLPFSQYGEAYLAVEFRRASGQIDQEALSQ